MTFLLRIFVLDKRLSFVIVLQAGERETCSILEHSRQFSRRNETFWERFSNLSSGREENSVHFFNRDCVKGFLLCSDRCDFFCLLQSIPSYSMVHKEAVDLAQVMKLPSFPMVTRDCLLHPIPLAVRYLLESNLPGE